ncbi:MAG: hypothetical protein EB127_28545 [Alphaproteobacteria bacterium]|nr:hypothetical protein [Alphaproteobacteria bacterium]
MSFQELLEQVGYDPISYSGRGMFGKTCIGVVTSDIGSLVADVVSLLNGSHYSTFDEVSDAFRYMKTDSMGRDMIVYFPRIEYQSE